MEKNVWTFVIGALLIGGLVGYAIKGQGATDGQKEESAGATPTLQETVKPSAKFDLHIDAEKHFPGDEKQVAHHYCKQVSGGLTECQLYESDEPDAKLVGVEVVVDSATWKTFNATERAKWHYHKEEIPKVNAKLPDLSPEEAAKVAKSLEETYGKVYLLWDPSQSDQPLGNPSLTILK